MPAVKAANPREIFGRDDWAAITRVSRWRGAWLALHAWLVVAFAAGGTAWLLQSNLVIGLAAVPLALAILGGRQLGLSILMHEGAHGLLHPDRKLNNFIGQWITATATGSDLYAYRSYHLTHHKFTQQPEDPDLSLSSPFPASRASLRRKIIRDLTGQTFYKQRSHQFAVAMAGILAVLRGNRDTAEKRDNAAGKPFNKQSRNGIEAPVVNMAGAILTAKTVGRFLLVQALLLAISLATFGWIPFLLWLAALATTFQLFLRIRNIAEHACTTTGSADPFSHARTTIANFWERCTYAPYWVNYHAEHHLFMGVPCYQLPAAHVILGKGGYHSRMTISRGYGDVMRQVVTA
jgi:fatty acid desaturase